MATLETFDQDERLSEKVQSPHPIELISSFLSREPLNLRTRPADSVIIKVGYPGQAIPGDILWN
ncbi:MAG: hypothetical protein WCJ64_06445 [Rhodospirillaceae bacterium]